MKATFVAPSIKCDGCANAIKQALTKYPGVLGVKVDVPTKTVTVLADDTVTPANVATALKQAGHPVSA